MSGNSIHFTHVAGGNGSALYRLKIVSTDGSFTISNTIVVAQDGRILFTISPNPGRGRFVIKGDAALTGIHMKITSAEGRQAVRRYTRQYGYT